jgi:hypothetical protein
MRSKAEQEEIVKRALAMPSQEMPERDTVDATEGTIVAVKIASTVLSAAIWLAFKDNFKPDDGEPLAVFYADEIPILAQKTPDELREIHETKLAYPGCRVIQEGPEGSKR